MRFIVMHKVDDKMEAGAPPDFEIVKKMGGLIGESLKNGTFQDGAGLHRSARRVRVRCEGGTCAVQRGPYAGDNELVESMALVRTDSIDEAVAVAQQYGMRLGDVEIEVGPVVEAWDLTGAPKPANIQGEQFLLLFKGKADDERARPDRTLAITQVDEELRSRGVLQKRHAIAPSGAGRRLSASKGKRTWTDGPFAESKELIAGFSILEVPSLDAAIAWADRYAAILADSEVDVRALA